MKRRDFLKLTGLLGAGAVAPVSINETDPYGTWKPLPPQRYEKAGTVCPLCPSFCRIELHKKRELIFGMHPAEKGRGLCPKGIAHHNVLYNRNRIKTPLLRAGARGSVSFRPVDYDTAIAVLKERAGAGFRTDAWAPGEADRFYIGAISDKVNFHPDARLQAFAKADRVYFDLANADLVINVGGDLLTEGELADRMAVMPAVAKRTITFSPMLPGGTALGERWYPVRPEYLAEAVRGVQRALGKSVSQSLDEIVRKTGIPAGEFDAVAARVKEAKKVCVSFSPALLEREDGAVAVAAALALANDLKAVGREGGLLFFNSLTPSRPFDIMDDSRAPYFACNVDPFMLYPWQGLAERLTTLPFVVYMGHHHADISRIADLILPAPFHVEHDECYLRRSGRGFSLVTAGTAVAGGAESVELRNRENIEVLFQKLLNLKAPYGIRDVDELARAIKPSLPSRAATIARIDKSARVSAVTPAPAKDAAPLREKSLSVHLYSDNVLDGHTRGSRWAEEMSRSNPLLVNSTTAARLGVRHGLQAVLKAGGGEVRGTVFVYEGIADGTIGVKRHRIRMAEGNAYARAAAGGDRKDPETKLVWWRDADLDFQKFVSSAKFAAGPSTLAIGDIEVRKA